MVEEKLEQHEERLDRHDDMLSSPDLLLQNLGTEEEKEKYLEGICTSVLPFNLNV